jgi:hypothetical protein
MAHSWTQDDVAQCEDDSALLVEQIRETLDDNEYFDWLENGNAHTFSPDTAKAILLTLRAAREERIAEAQIALRRLDKMLTEMREEILYHLGEEE